jgi:hypothetical protein
MCTVIRRIREPRPDDRGWEPPEDAEPPEQEGNRNLENAVLLGFFVVLVVAGIWLLGTMADLRRVQDCAAQGRRNCGTIEVPERSR